ncbi:MAG TPA: OsmC family protein [Chitinophagales bacterium]|nr:OsmC family protein [Chitinophagales bacterium]
MKRYSTAVWKGTGKDGQGHLTSESQTLKNTPYSYNTRFENEIGTNPEELLAAAHAGCFTMQLAFYLQEAGYKADQLETKSTIKLEDSVITSSDLKLKASIKDISKEEFGELVEKAKNNCPVSKLFKAEISIHHTLNSE